MKHQNNQFICLSGVCALPLAAARNEGGHYFRYFGPSGVRALPLAAGIKEGGHYFRYFGLSGVCALPLAAGINEGGHYFRYIFLFLVLVFLKAEIFWLGPSKNYEFYV